MFRFTFPVENDTDNIDGVNYFYLSHEYRKPLKEARHCRWAEEDVLSNMEIVFKTQIQLDTMNEDECRIPKVTNTEIPLEN